MFDFISDIGSGEVIIEALYIACYFFLYFFCDIFLPFDMFFCQIVRRKQIIEGIKFFAPQILVLSSRFSRIHKYLGGNSSFYDSHRLVFLLMSNNNQEIEFISIVVVACGAEFNSAKSDFSIRDTKSGLPLQADIYQVKVLDIFRVCFYCIKAAKRIFRHIEMIIGLRVENLKVDG